MSNYRVFKTGGEDTAGLFMWVYLDKPKKSSWPQKNAEITRKNQ